MTRPTGVPCGTIRRPGLRFPPLTKIAEMAGHGILVMGDENAILYHREPEDFGVGDTVEFGRKGALKIYGWFVAQHAGADGTAKIVIGLEPRLHLFRASGMELFARVSEALAQVLRQRHRSSSRSFEALLLAHPISINCRLVFEVEGDRAEDLGESQSFEFSQDRFRRESFVEALDDGIQRYASTGQIVPALPLFDVFFRHPSQL